MGMVEAAADPPRDQAVEDHRGQGARHLGLVVVVAAAAVADQAVVGVEAADPEGTGVTHLSQVPPE